MRKIYQAVWALLCTICFPIWISDTTLAFSNSIFSVAFFSACLWVFRREDACPCDTRMKRYTLVLGFLFSAMTACGYALENHGYIPYGDVKYLAVIAAYGGAISALLRIIWKRLERTEKALSESEAAMSGLERIVHGVLRHPAVVMLLLFVCWLPCYISTFPGNFVYDATAEYYQMTKGYDGDFPMLHSALIVRLIAYAYALTGSHNTGIAIYVIVQMALLAALFAFMLCDLHRLGISCLPLGAMLVYYAASPVIAILATCTVRDVMFGALLMYAVFLLYVMYRDKKAFFSSPIRPAVLGVVLVLTLFSRNNNAGMLMAIAFGLVGLLIGWSAGKENRRGRRVLWGAMILCWAFLGAALPVLCRPMNPPTTGAAISLMTQSISRAYIEKQDLWTEKEKDAFARFFENTQNIAYNPENADLTKFNYIGKKEEFGDFFKLWTAVGLKCPACYLDAILANTRQMWFPDCVIDGYMYNDPEYLKRYEKSYFHFGDEIDAPGEHLLLLPQVRAYYNRIAQKISFERIPVISMLFSIGFQFWLLLNCCFYAAYKRMRVLYMPLAVILVYMLLGMCVPLVLVRYFCMIFFAAPLIIIFTLQPEKAAGIN